MAEPYTATINKSWVAVAGPGFATVTTNKRSGTLYWCVTLGDEDTAPDLSLIGGEFNLWATEEKSFGDIPVGSFLRLRSSGNHVVTVHPDVRPDPLPDRG